MVNRANYRKSGRSFLPAAILFIAAAIIAGMVFFYWHTAALEDQKAQSEAVENQLKSSIAELKTQLDDLKAGKQPDTGMDAPIQLKPKPGWEAYFPKPDTTTLLGESTGKVRGLLGEPPFLVRSTAANPELSREIWVYIPYDEDPTGLYIYFKGSRVVKSRLDEFAGFTDFYLLEDPVFK